MCSRVFSKPQRLRTYKCRFWEEVKPYEEVVPIAQLAEDHGVTQVDVGRGGVHAELGAERPAAWNSNAPMSVSDPDGLARPR